MLEQVFGSKTRLKLLRTLFREPDRPFFVRELARAVDAQINAVRREIRLLEQAGIIKESAYTAQDTTKSGASLRKYHAVDRESIIYEELQALLLKEQVMGERQLVSDIQKKSGDVLLLLLSGRFTQDDRAPSDLLIVGKIKPRALAKLIEQYEKDFGFEIRYTVMTEDEFAERRYVMDKFIFSLFEARNLKPVNRLDV